MKTLWYRDFKLPNVIHVYIFIYTYTIFIYFNVGFSLFNFLFYI